MENRQCHIVNVLLTKGYYFPAQLDECLKIFRVSSIKGILDHVDKLSFQDEQVIWNYSLLEITILHNDYVGFKHILNKSKPLEISDNDSVWQMMLASSDNLTFINYIFRNRSTLFSTADKDSFFYKILGYALDIDGELNITLVEYLLQQKDCICFDNLTKHQRFSLAPYFNSPNSTFYRLLSQTKILHLYQFVFLVDKGHISSIHFLNSLFPGKEYSKQRILRVGNSNPLELEITKKGEKDDQEKSKSLKNRQFREYISKNQDKFKESKFYKKVADGSFDQFMKTIIIIAIIICVLALLVTGELGQFLKDWIQRIQNLSGWNKVIYVLFLIFFIYIQFIHKKKPKRK